MVWCLNGILFLKSGNNHKALLTLDSETYLGLSSDFGVSFFWSPKIPLAGQTLNAGTFGTTHSNSDRANSHFFLLSWLAIVLAMVHKIAHSSSKSNLRNKPKV
jgi:hypothetical protein